jgi:hypothetical protein
MRPAGGVLRAAELEARLHATRPIDGKLGLRQVDLVRGQYELRLRGEDLGERQVDWRAVRREVNQRRIGEAHVAPPGRRGDGRIGRPSSRMVSVFSRL